LTFSKQPDKLLILDWTLLEDGIMSEVYRIWKT